METPTGPRDGNNGCLEFRKVLVRVRGGASAWSSNIQSESIDWKEPTISWNNTIIADHSVVCGGVRSTGGWWGGGGGIGYPIHRSLTSHYIRSMGRFLWLPFYSTPQQNSTTSTRETLEIQRRPSRWTCFSGGAWLIRIIPLSRHKLTWTPFTADKSPQGEAPSVDRSTGWTLSDGFCVYDIQFVT